MTDRPPPARPAVTVTATREHDLADDVASVTELVLRDLHANAAPPVHEPGTVEIADGSPPGSLTVTLRGSNGLLGGFGVYATSGKRAVAHLQVADGLAQEFVLLHQTTAPVCPDHRHPAQAAVRDDRVVWRCPTSETAFWPLGTLPAATV
ncbi:hypothetical protein AB0425_31685 [Actinosynnema sp. NPDC051121]|nr:hypothetical protein [Saccharothrix sp.]